MGAMSSKWPMVVGVVVDAPAAVHLNELLDEGRRRARSERWSIPANVVETMDAIARLARLANRQAEEEPPRQRSWMDTATAAALLGVSTRRVVALVHEHKLDGRKVGGRWMVDSSDVTARMPTPEQNGTPSESGLRAI